MKKIVIFCIIIFCIIFLFPILFTVACNKLQLAEENGNLKYNQYDTSSRTKKSETGSSTKESDTSSDAKNNDSDTSSNTKDNR